MDEVLEAQNAPQDFDVSLEIAQRHVTSEINSDAASLPL